MTRIRVIGGGLAGSEAAYQLARRGLPVTLLEARPEAQTPAHTTDKLAELVCSNSLGSGAVGTGKGLLAAEMEACDSLIIQAAKAAAVPAGTALAVNRSRFSEQVERALSALPDLIIERGVATEVPDAPAIIATGPLTSDALARELARFAGVDHLYFYDATSPIVDGDSIDRSIAFIADRRGKGDGDYFNCPLDQEEYERFYQALSEAALVTPHQFEDEKVFEGCMPIEQLARRGKDTLRFGPMRPVGLIDPRSGKRPYAVVQLRREDVAGEAWNLVGFQTRMQFGAQREVLRLIPGLQDARIVRFGVIHRNTYVDGPRALDGTLSLKSRSGVRLAGQLTGVEGYMESAAMGLLAALYTAADHAGLTLPPPPSTTMLGALLAYVTGSEHQPIEPMNSNFGLLPPMGHIRNKVERKKQMHHRGIKDLGEWINEFLRGLFF